MKDFDELQLDFSLVATGHLGRILRRIVAKMNVVSTLVRLVNYLYAMTIWVPIRRDCGGTGSRRSDVGLIRDLPCSSLSVAGLSLPLAPHAVNSTKAVSDIPMPNDRLALVARELEKRPRKKLAAREHRGMENVSAQ
jgi:hypothetical protein